MRGSSVEIILNGDDDILARVATALVAAPWEYGMTGPVGKRYDAMKDLLTAYGVDWIEWISVAMTAGTILAAEMSKG